jgi:hypothetical protein
MIAQLDARLRRLVTAGTIAFFAAGAFAYWTLTLIRSDRLEGPPVNVLGDEPEYDNIAYQLWKHDRFALMYQDSSFLAAYLDSRHASTRNYATSVAARLSGTTAYRPPLFPATMAATEMMFGRHFAPVRLLNLVYAALALWLIVWVCRSVLGPSAAVAAFALFLLDGRFASYGALLMTEDLNGVLVALTLAVLVLRMPRNPYAYAAVAGAVWGLATLARTGMILWLPALAVTVATILWQQGRSVLSVGTRLRQGASAAAIFTATCLVILSPWLVRNVHVLEAAMPLGSQGYMELPAGFSDGAVANQGEWKPGDSTTHTDGVSLPAHERARAIAGKAVATAWIRSHPVASVRLAIQKIRNEWRPASTAAAWLLLAALLGLICYRGTPLVLVCSGLIAGDFTMIAATWSFEGRFTFSAAPALFCLGAAGVLVMLRSACDFRHQLLHQARADASSSG